MQIREQAPQSDLSNRSSTHSLQPVHSEVSGKKNDFFHAIKKEILAVPKRQTDTALLKKVLKAPPETCNESQRVTLLSIILDNAGALSADPAARADDDIESEAENLLNERLLLETSLNYVTQFINKDKKGTPLEQFHEAYLIGMLRDIHQELSERTTGTPGVEHLKHHREMVRIKAGFLLKEEP